MAEALTKVRKANASMLVDKLYCLSYDMAFISAITAQRSRQL